MRRAIVDAVAAIALRIFSEIRFSLRLLKVLFVGSLLWDRVSLPSDLPNWRFKADLLLTVAHPDDKSAIGAFLLKPRLTNISVLPSSTEHGNGGDSAIGEEQAASLRAIRESERRRALAFLGITNVWFLDGPNTPGQDVLRSLKTWNYGRALGKLVRFVHLWGFTASGSTGSAAVRKLFWN